MNSIKLKKNNKEIIINKKIKSEKIEKKINKKLIFLKKTYIIDGFRKGKAPIKLIEKNFKDNIIKDVLNKLIHTSFLKILKKKKIKKYSNLKYFLEKYKKGKDYNYTIKFNITKNKLLNKLKLIKINKLNIKITNQDIDTIFLNFKKNLSKWVNTKKPIKENDKVKIKFKLISKNKKIILKKNNFIIFIKKNFLLKKIHKKIIGKKINDKIKVKIKFSKYHPEKKIIEKKNIFLIKIIKIKEKKEKKINFNKLKKLGIKEKNIQELKKNIYINLINEAKKMEEKYLKNEFIKKWIKINKKSFSKQKILNFIKNIKKYIYLKYKNNKNIFDKSYNKNIKKEALKKIIINNLIQKIIKKESFYISKKLIKKIYKQTKNQFKKNKKKENHIKKRKILSHIKKILLIEKAFYFIFNHILIKEKQCNFIKALKKIKNIIL
ncbi:trigger factor [Buchnera aphidicola (Periphyllus koelreuteriae)]|uniref:trigger factor n=1 Tax=Buchnera aphidicola TaxID=9 RepID=UPI0031B86012